MALFSFLRRSVAPSLLSLALAACTADGLVPSARLDDTTQVNSITPIDRQRRVERQTAYPGLETPVTTTDSLGTAGDADPLPIDAAVDPVDPVLSNADTGGTQRTRLPMIDSDEALSADSQASMGVQPLQVPEGGVNMDEALGVTPVVGLAQEQSQEIAEGNATQPVVDGIGSEDPVQVSMPEPVEEGLPQTEMQLEIQDQSIGNDQSQATLPRRNTPLAEEEQQVAFLPRVEDPTIERQSTGVLPASERRCRAELKRLGVVFNDIAPIASGPACGIPYPIELSGLSGGIGVRPATKLNCQLTLAFAKWVKYELAPSARYRYFSGVKTIVPLGGYSCRRMNSSGRNPWSEHAKGNAIDVGKFVLKNGKQIDVRKKGFFAFREKALLKAVRTDSCKYFHTVLGPGSDRHHKDHFHFDLRSRKSGYHHCD